MGVVLVTNQIADSTGYSADRGAGFQQAKPLHCLAFHKQECCAAINLGPGSEVEQQYFQCNANIGRLVKIIV